VEEALVRAYGAGAQAHPEVTLAPEAFAEHVAALLPAG
jgi:hypothetical protein